MCIRDSSGTVIDRVRRVRVVVNLNKVIARAGWPTCSQFTDQDRAWLIRNQDRSSGTVVSDGQVHWIRKHDQERFVLFGILVIRQDRYRDRLDLFSLCEVN